MCVRACGLLCVQGGQTPTFIAAATGQTDCIPELVKGGADVNKARKVGAWAATATRTGGGVGLV